MSLLRSALIFSACGVSFGTVACKNQPSEPAPSVSAVRPAVASAEAPQPKAKPWFSGGFSGDYQATVAAVDVKAGAIKEWSKDDGKLASGPGKLTVQIDDAGQVDGTSEGALGAGRVSGKVEDDTLRVQLSPSDDAGLHGVLIATRDGDGFKGSIEASSGDSLHVRTASVELKKLSN
jgi:hypothetical protein